MWGRSPDAAPECGELHSDAGAPPSSTFEGAPSPSAPPLTQRSPPTQSLLLAHGFRLLAQRSAGQRWPDGHSASLSQDVTFAGWHQLRSQVKPLGQADVAEHAVMASGAQVNASWGSASAGEPMPNENLYWVSCAHWPRPNESRSIVSLLSRYIELPTSVAASGRLRNPNPPGVFRG